MVENEACLNIYFANMCDTEVAIYPMSKQHQGQEIPRLLAQVQTEQDAPAKVGSADLFDIKESH
jgi:hypothetical protein